MNSENLIDQKNILLKKLHENESIQVLNKVKIIPLLVPHRDEFSETVGYKIVGPKKRCYLFQTLIKRINFSLLNSYYGDLKVLTS